MIYNCPCTSAFAAVKDCNLPRFWVLSYNLKLEKNSSIYFQACFMKSCKTLDFGQLVCLDEQQTYVLMCVRKLTSNILKNFLLFLYSTFLSSLFLEKTSGIALNKFIANRFRTLFIFFRCPPLYLRHLSVAWIESKTKFQQGGVYILDSNAVVGNTVQQSLYRLFASCEKRVSTIFVIRNHRTD